MSPVIDQLKRQFDEKKIQFTKKPILIGGMAMEYYSMRQSGADIDLLICDEDYQLLACKFPNDRKDIWGDLGVIIDPLEIWRCIMLLDYNFYLKDAIDEGIAYVVSLDRLLLTRVLAMDVPKYMDDLKLMKNYYLGTFMNKGFLKTQEEHIDSYRSTHDGVIFGGKYID